MSGSNFVVLRLSAILLALAPTLLVYAQQAESTASIHGIVVNAVTHQPIARALVTLDQYSQSMLTDNEGRFTFDGVSSTMAPISLSARRPGFSADDAGGNNAERVLLSLPVTADVTIELTPQSSITGELIPSGNDAPDSFQLQLLHQEIQNGRASWSFICNVESTSDGHFRFGNLAAGAYLVHVGVSPDPLPAQPPSGTVKIRSGYVPVFYPAAREIAGAGVITLNPGQQADIRMELTREPFYPVTIPVANADEARDLGFEVSSDSFLGISARFSRQDGMVHVDLPSGHYLLEGHGFGPRQTGGQREFDVNGAPTRTGAITLLPLDRIPVTVRTDFTHTALQTENGAGSASAPPTASSLLSLDLQPQSKSRSPRGQRANLQDDASSAASGTSYLVDAGPGKYWVSVRAFIGYVASITSGGVDLLDSPLTIAPGGSAAPIDITLRDDMASLTASLSASLASSLQAPGQPAHSFIYLQLIPLSAGGDFFAQPVSAASNSSKELHLAPGRYLALASLSSREFAYRNPAILAALSAQGKTITLDPGASASVTIENLLDPRFDPAGSAP